MTWSAPRTWTTGEVVTAAMMNTDVRDNMTETMHRITETILGSNTASPVTITVPSSTYRHIELVIVTRSTNASSTTTLAFQFNGDTGTNYQYLSMLAQSGGASVAEPNASATASMSGINVPAASAVAGKATYTRLFIPDYARTVFHKGALITSGYFFDNIGGASSSQFFHNLGQWNSTSAITSISVLLGAGSFISGSTFTLYGHSG